MWQRRKEADPSPLVVGDFLPVASQLLREPWGL